MPGRAIPDWLLELLTGISVGKGANASKPDGLLTLLALVKRGVRSRRSIAIRLGVDHGYAKEMIARATELGLLTSQVRLTAAGLDRLIQSCKSTTLPKWDRSLYIPSLWCADRATVQPSIQMKFTSVGLTDSVEVSASTDGDVGQASLERPDAKTATPSFSVASHLPSASRKRRDTDGPKGSKER